MYHIITDSNRKKTLINPKPHYYKPESLSVRNSKIYVISFSLKPTPFFINFKMAANWNSIICDFMNLMIVLFFNQIEIFFTWTHNPRLKHANFESARLSWNVKFVNFIMAPISLISIHNLFALTLFFVPVQVYRLDMLSVEIMYYVVEKATLFVTLYIYHFIYIN